ncbi:MAG: hypothetical protein M3R62_12880 [Acidobacteriota bacterium]|nr:hypothetical protein [Acidobacteriota bacterium]
MRGQPSSPLSIALVAVLLALSDPRATAEEKKMEVKIKIGECEEALATNMPGGMSALVEREGEATTPECAAAALGQTRQAITESKMFTAMGKGAAITVNLLRKVSGVGLAGEAAAKALEALLESGGTLDGFKEKLGENAGETGVSELAGHAGWKLGDETSEFLSKELAEKIFKVLQSEHVSDSHEMGFHLGFCEGSIVITLDYSIEQGTGEVRIAVTGDCHCTPFRGGVRIGRFSVIGVAPVSFSKPVKGFGGWEIPCKLGQPRYYVWAPCCQQSEGHWTTPGDAPPPPNPEEPQTTEPPPGKNKENTDYRAVMDRCDPTGRLKDLIRWNERMLQHLYDQKADAKRIAFRKGELAKAQKELCDCLRKMKSDRSLAGDAGMQKLLDDLIRSYCSPPAEPKTSRPPETPGTTPVRDVCQDAKDAYEQARSKYLDGGGNNPGLELTMVSAKKAYCECLRKKYGNKLPPDLEAFCNPKQLKMPSRPPTEPTTGQPSAPAKKTSILIGVVLPTDCHPGDTVTGTVVLNPKDYEGIPALRVVELQVPLESGADGKPTLHGVTVELGSGHGQPADGPITCTIPKDGSKISVTVGRTDTPQQIARTDVSVIPQSPVAPAPQYETPPVCVNNGRPQVIHGPFSGNGSTTNIEVGGRPGLVIAETPREVYYSLPGGTAAGDNTVVLHESGKGTSFHVCVVNLGMSADRLNLLRGESTNFTTTVSGLDGLPSSAWLGGMPSDLVDLEWIRRVAPDFKIPGAGQPGVLLLTIENRSPDTITLGKAKGEVIVLTIDRGAVKNGAYEFRGTIHSKKSGGFTIRGTVVPFLAPVEGTPSR